MQAPPAATVHARRPPSGAASNSGVLLAGVSPGSAVGAGGVVVLFSSSRAKATPGSSVGAMARIRFCSIAEGPQGSFPELRVSGKVLECKREGDGVGGGCGRWNDGIGSFPACLRA